MQKNFNNLIIHTATEENLDSILQIVQDARQLFASHNSTQWRQKDGYPNRAVFMDDISKNQLFVAVIDNQVVGFMALVVGVEKSYEKIDGKWLNDDDYISLHRIAISKKYYGTGLADQLIKFAQSYISKFNIKNLRGDTHITNLSMQRLFKRNGFTLCGEVQLVSVAEDNLRQAYHYVAKQ